MKFFSHPLSLVVVLGMCSACGQKGKLVLPVKPAAISTPYPTAQPKKVDGDTESKSETELETKPADVTPAQVQEKD